MSYTKPPCSYEQQLDILKSRGLVVHDEGKALHCLEHHNYYRLSAYRCVLTQQGSSDQFIDGATFDQLWSLYCFDRELRLLVMEAVKRLEISVRAHWAYTLGHKYGAQAYEDVSVFRNPGRHTSALCKLDDELRRSHEVFVSHFRQQYNMVRPPIWAACEIMSFGLLSRFYENLRRESDKKAIARVYDLSANGLKSLLEHAVYVRNLCAHHSRLWNRRFTITVALPKNRPNSLVESLNPAADRRVYNTLTLLAHIVNIVEPENHWKDRMRRLIEDQNIPVTEHMGFPDNWKDSPLWQEE